MAQRLGVPKLSAPTRQTQSRSAAFAALRTAAERVSHS
jgi:hypothetical protein